jgi:hypothetical protein
MESQRVGQLSEAKIWGSGEQVTVKIWGPDEQVIGVSSNSSAGASHLSLTYPLTLTIFLTTPYSLPHVSLKLFSSPITLLDILSELHTMPSMERIKPDTEIRLCGAV